MFAFHWTGQRIDDPLPFLAGKVAPADPADPADPAGPAIKKAAPEGGLPIHIMLQ